VYARRSALPRRLDRRAHLPNGEAPFRRPYTVNVKTPCEGQREGRAAAADSMTTIDDGSASLSSRRSIFPPRTRYRPPWCAHHTRLRPEAVAVNASGGVGRPSAAEVAGILLAKSGHRAWHEACVSLDLLERAQLAQLFATLVAKLPHRIHGRRLQ